LVVDIPHKIDSSLMLVVVMVVAARIITVFFVSAPN
jgi:hypothetical protein